MFCLEAASAIKQQVFIGSVIFQLLGFSPLVNFLHNFLTQVSKIFIMATSSASKNSMSINDLPLEDFLEVFNYISLDEAVTSCSNVCVQWKEAIALHIVAPNIRGLTRSNLEFKTFLEKKGWNQESQDVEKILSLHYRVDISNFFSSKYSLQKISQMAINWQSV